MGEPAFRDGPSHNLRLHQYDQYNGPDGIAWRLSTLIWAGFQGRHGMGRSERYWCQAYPASLAVRQIRRLSPDYSSVEDFPENPGSLDFADGFYGQTGVHESVRGRFASSPTPPWFPPRGA
jgi:hypothetical protein